MAPRPRWYELTKPLYSEFKIVTESGLGALFSEDTGGRSALPGLSGPEKIGKPLMVQLSDLQLLLCPVSTFRGVSRWVLFRWIGVYGI